MLKNARLMKFDKTPDYKMLATIGPEGIDGQSGGDSCKICPSKGCIGTYLTDNDRNGKRKGPV